MIQFLAFRCCVCNARIKAPVEIVGQTHPCPRCTHPFLIEPPEESHEEAALGVTDGAHGSRFALR